MDLEGKICYARFLESKLLGIIILKCKRDVQAILIIGSAQLFTIQVLNT